MNIVWAIELRGKGMPRALREVCHGGPYRISEVVMEQKVTMGTKRRRGRGRWTKMPAA
jgi:hypothetical protein